MLQTPEVIPPPKTLISHLVTTNPLTEEGARAWRKFFRVAGGPGRGLSYVALGMVVLIYVWLLYLVAISRGDMTGFVAFLQLAIVTIAMPMSIYGAISGERERTTWEALILTRLTPGQIVAGKALWRLAALSALMVAFLPALLLSVWTQRSAGTSGQGISVWQIEMLTWTWGAGLCAFGLWVSANTRRSVTSAAIIFISLLGVLVLLPALLTMVDNGNSLTQADFSGNYGMWTLMHINAFYALGEMLSPKANASGDPLLGGGWGTLQIVLYTVGLALFLYVSYRSLKIWEEPRHRLG